MVLTIDQALQKAVEAHKAGQIQEADRLYTAILKVQSKHPDANHNMGVLAVRVGKVETALPFFKTALEANPKVAQFWLSYIDALIKLDRLTDAKAVLDQAKSKGAKGDRFDMLEQRLRETGEESVATSKIAAEAPPPQPNILYSLELDQAISLAKYKAKEGDPEKAKRIYQDILIKFPKNKRASDGLKGLTDKTVRKASKGQNPPQDQLQSLANLYNQGQLQQALKQAETLVQKFPQSAILFNIQGVSLNGLGQLDAAIKAYNKALAIKPDYTDAHYNMGIALQDQGKLEEAIEAYNKALAIKPDYAAAYNNMGNALKEQSKLEEAIGAYNKALAIKPNYVEPYNNIGIALKKQGKLEEAIEAYNKALAIKPDNADAIENSQSLAVQLLPIIANYGYDFDSSEAKVNPEIVLRPMYQIQNAIKAYLEDDFIQAVSHINNFKACDQNLLGRLKPKDKVFCNAYSFFIGRLLDATWDEEPTSENKVYHLGESHSLSYAHRNITIHGSDFRIAPRITFGAKAFHFSRTKEDSFKAITKAHFVSLPKNSKVFLSFGEIDCRPNEGFISAARKRDKPLEELIDQTTEGYVQWFLEQNAAQRHQLYFINVPAPVYNEKLATDINSEVARTVALFNTALQKYSLQHGFEVVDVFKFTVGKEEFSNGLFHVDRRHLGAKALEEIQRQLC